MAATSFLVFIFVSNLVLLHSAQEAQKSPPVCPPFECGIFGPISFPFFNITHRDCGLCALDCSVNYSPKLQLQNGGRWYHVVNMLPRGIAVLDQLLQERLSDRNCDSFKDFPLPKSPSISFTFLNNVTFFKCISSSELTPKTTEYFRGNYSYDQCPGYSVYYSYSNNRSSDTANLPPNCSAIQLPVVPEHPNQNLHDPFEMLTAELWLEWHVSGECYECHYKGGKCQYDEDDKFHCANLKANVKEGRSNLKVILGTVIPGGFIFIICMLIFIIRRHPNWNYAAYFLSRNTSSDPSSRRDLEGGSVYFGVPVFSYRELEDATNNFDPSKELGDGGFGTVYYGKLRDGREVAVKRLYEHNYKRVEQFKNEIEILTRLRHQNLVSLYGCTSRHSRELLLVYEYIPNGTVADHLHGDQAKNGSLTWPIRMKIAIETANALAYLHKSDIIHRDVKTNNILLDNNFCVKVADFGLSRLFPTDVSHVSTAPQGTPGYVDPEYHQCYQLTDKSDVYSFGVVLIELISSMPAVDISRHRHEINLANLAINRIQKCAFNELIDPCLGFESDATVNRMTTSVAELAFQCLQLEKEMRPTMEEALETLKGIQGEEYKIVRPNPSPEYEDVVLLKNTKSPSSPDSVTDKWLISSSSTTATNSG